MNKKFIHTFCRRCEHRLENLAGDTQVCFMAGGPTADKPYTDIENLKSCPRGLGLVSIFKNDRKPRAPRKPMNPETERILHDCLAGFVAGIIAAALIILFLYTINSK